MLDKMVLWSSAKTDDEHREPAVNLEEGACCQPGRGRQYQGNTWTEEKLGHMMDWEDKNDDVDVKQKPRTCR